VDKIALKYSLEVAAGGGGMQKGRKGGCTDRLVKNGSVRSKKGVGRKCLKKKVEV
jgi:hypothetical protein